MAESKVCFYCDEERTDFSKAEQTKHRPRCRRCAKAGVRHVSTKGDVHIFEIGADFNPRNWR